MMFGVTVMSKEELAKLLLKFIDDYEPESALYNKETIDEKIEQAPYEMLRQLAYFIRGDYE